MNTVAHGVPVAFHHQLSEVSEWFLWKMHQKFFDWVYIWGHAAVWYLTPDILTLHIMVLKNITLVLSTKLITHLLPHVCPFTINLLGQCVLWFNRSITGHTPGCGEDTCHESAHWLPGQVTTLSCRSLTLTCMHYLYTPPYILHLYLVLEAHHLRSWEGTVMDDNLLQWF